MASRPACQIYSTSRCQQQILYRAQRIKGMIRPGQKSHSRHSRDVEVRAAPDQYYSGYPITCHNHGVRSIRLYSTQVASLFEVNHCRFVEKNFPLEIRTLKSNHGSALLSTPLLSSCPRDQCSFIGDRLVTI